MDCDEGWKQIGLDENKRIGLAGTINYQTLTDNPRTHERATLRPTNKRTQPRPTNLRTNEQPTTYERTNTPKIKRAHVANIKHSTRTQRKNKRRKTA